MGESKTVFKLAERVLLKCWLLGAGVLILAFGGYMLAHDFVGRLHGALFGMSSHELDLVFYCGLGFIKLLVILCFFIPWLSIKWTLPRDS